MTLERPQTPHEFQTMFRFVYTDANKRYSDDHLVMRLVEETCALMEVARKDTRDAFLIHLPRIFAWENAVANRMSISLQEALWEKYPGVCPYCLREKDCVCGLEHSNIPDKEAILRRLRKERDGREPKLLQDHQGLHKRLYGWQNKRIMLIQAAAHLAEEAGEVSKAFRHNQIQEVGRELADVTSRIFALTIRIDADLADLTWQRYPYECEKCHEEKCSKCT